MGFEFKIRQTVAGISVTNQFHEFLSLIFLAGNDVEAARAFL